MGYNTFVSVVDSERGEYIGEAGCAIAEVEGGYEKERLGGSERQEAPASKEREREREREVKERNRHK